MDSRNALSVEALDPAIAIQQLSSRDDRLILVATFPNHTPETLFDHWIRPELLQQWWPPAAEIEPCTDGTYHLCWPERDWHLRGRYTGFQSGQRLAFTWQWDHDPAVVPATQVDIAFYPLLGGGTVLTLIHERYADTPAGRDLRAEHLEGWTHFLARLQGLTGA
jgi:uncharacterized protein YndB with AHSA1/START domain